MIVHSPIIACGDCGAPAGAICDKSCPSALAAHAREALSSVEAYQPPCCDGRDCLCGVERHPDPSQYPATRRCEDCRGYIDHPADVVDCGTHVMCRECATHALCSDCRLLMAEADLDRHEDAAYAALRDAS